MIYNGYNGNKFKTIAEGFNMLVSRKKTQAMVIAKEPIRCKLVVNDHIIEQVMGFSYLGVETSSDRYLVNEVRTQANKAARIAGYLRDTIWQNKYMSMKSKIRIYKACGAHLCSGDKSRDVADERDDEDYGDEDTENYQGCQPQG